LALFPAEARHTGRARGGRWKRMDLPDTGLVSSFDHQVGVM
jgi:hypothetical protein